MTAQRLCPVLVLLVGSTAGAQPATTAELVFRARQILVKHCAECHGEKPTPSTLGLLDHAQLLAKTNPVPLVRAREASASQVLDLIEEGSMPPGDRAKVSPADAKILRAWIEDGAKAYPIRFDDEFAYATILADVEKLPAADLKNTRYLTLHHLAADGSNADLMTARTDFVAGVKSVINRGAPGPVPLDPTHTVFRLDIGKADWGQKRFTRLDNRAKAVDDPLGDLFDVVLLEYPYAVIPRRSDAFDQLTQRFLAKVEQVRPFVFVRGDWFVSTVTTAPLADDLRELIAPIPPGLSHPKPRVARKTDAAPAPEGADPIPALDAWYGLDPAAHPKSPPGFTTDTYDRPGDRVRRQFVPGDQLSLRFGADADAYFQFVWIDGSNTITPSLVEQTLAGKRGVKFLPDEKTDVLRFEGTGKERFLVYAAPHKFAEGAVWRAIGGTTERYVHPFFKIKQEGGISKEDLRIARKTVPIEIAPKK